MPLKIFRFTQAGSEVSALLGRMPSAVGYQPTLATEMGQLQERITSTKVGSVTSIQAIYVPADDYTDPAPATTFAHQADQDMICIYVAIGQVGFAVCYVVTPIPEIFLGLSLGFLVSYLNLLTIFQKTSLIGRITDKSFQGGQLQVLFAGLTYLIRISLVILALYIAMQFPDEVNLYSVIAGISLIYVICKLIIVVVMM